MPPATADVGPAIGDDVEAVAALALPDDDVARRCMYGPKPKRQVLDGRDRRRRGILVVTRWPSRRARCPRRGPRRGRGSSLATTATWSMLPFEDQSVVVEQFAFEADAV